MSHITEMAAETKVALDVQVVFDLAAQFANLARKALNLCKVQSIAERVGGLRSKRFGRSVHLLSSRRCLQQLGTLVIRIGLGFQEICLDQIVRRALNNLTRTAKTSTNLRYGRRRIGFYHRSQNHQFSTRETYVRARACKDSLQSAH